MILPSPDWFTYLSQAASAGVGSSISYLLMAGRVRRLELIVTAVLKMLLQSSGLSPDQRALMEAVLQNDPRTPQ